MNERLSAVGLMRPMLLEEPSQEGKEDQAVQVTSNQSKP